MLPSGEKLVDVAEAQAEDVDRAVRVAKQVTRGRAAHAGEDGLSTRQANEPPSLTGLPGRSDAQAGMRMGLAALLMPALPRA